MPFCVSALPAADFDDLLVLRSRRVFDAALAALAEVCFFGALVCDNALPAAALDALLVEPLSSVLEALLATFLRVTFLLTIFHSLLIL